MEDNGHTVSPNELDTWKIVKIVGPPDPVGFWTMGEKSGYCTRFAMFVKPTDEEIRNTEKLLGWKWKDKK